VVVELRAGLIHPKTLYTQLKSVGVTHVLFQTGLKSGGSPVQTPWLTLRDMGCLASRKKFKLRHFKSRTLPGLTDTTMDMEVFKLKDRRCLQ
jgi:hypothetical protein